MTITYRQKLLFIVWYSLFRAAMPLHAQNQENEHWVGKHFDAENSNINNNQKGAIEDENGFIWLATEGGLYRFNGEKFKFESKEFNKALQSDRYYGVFKTTDRRAVFLDGRYNLLTIKNSNPVAITLDNRTKENLIYTGISQIIIGADENKPFYRTLQNRALYSFRNEAGQVFLDTDTSYYYMESQSIYYVTPHAEKKLPTAGLNCNKTTLLSDSLFVLSEDNKLLGLYHKGRHVALYRTIGLDSAYSTVLGNQYAPFWVQGNTTYRLVLKNDKAVFKALYTIPAKEDEPVKYLVTKSGMHIILTKTQGIYWFRQVQGISALDYKGFPLASENNNVISIVEPSKGRVMSIGGLLDYSHITGLTVLHKKYMAALQRNDTVFMIVHDNIVYKVLNNKILDIWPPLPDKVCSDMIVVDGEICVIAKSGLYCFRHRQWELMMPLPIKSTEYANCAHRHDKYRYLYGGTEGLIMFDTRNKVHAPIAELKHTTVRWIHYDSSLKVTWVCTYGDGIYVLDSILKVVKLPLDYNGFMAFSHSITRHRSGTYWVPTNSGLFNIKESTIKKILAGTLHYVVYDYYTTSDGLPINEFNGGRKNSVITTSDGRLAFASQNGIILVDPDALNKNKERCYISIDRMYINNIIVRPKERFDLKSGFYTVRFELTSVNRHLASIPIFYRLTDSKGPGEWTEANSNGILEFIGFNSGEITLEFAVANYNGMFTVLRTVALDIAEPWYLTKTAIILYGVCLIGLVVLGYIIRIRVLREKSREQLQKERNAVKLALSELKALQAQINPHYLSNGLQALQYAIINNQTTMALECVRLYSQLMRKVLSMSEKQFITFAEEEAYLNNYLQLELFRFSGSFQYTINFQTDSKDTYYIPAMLIQPLVENAIIHGLQPKTEGSRELEISAVFGTIIVVSIRDNGVGRDARRVKKEHTSMGMDNVRMRIANISASLNVSISLSIEDLKDNDGNAAGTLVRLILPGFNKATLTTRYELLTYNKKI